MRSWFAVVLASVACAPRVEIPLDPPDGTVSVVLATFEGGAQIPRVIAFERDAPPEAAIVDLGDPQWRGHPAFRAVRAGGDGLS